MITDAQVLATLDALGWPDDRTTPAHPDAKFGFYWRQVTAVLQAAELAEFGPARAAYDEARDGLTRYQAEAGAELEHSREDHRRQLADLEAVTAQIEPLLQRLDAVWRDVEAYHERWRRPQPQPAPQPGWQQGVQGSQGMA